MTPFLDEAQLELSLLDMLKGIGYGCAFGPDIAPDGEHPERSDYGDPVLVEQLRQGLARINPKLPADAIPKAVEKADRRLAACRPDGILPSANSRLFAVDWRLFVCLGADASSAELDVHPGMCIMKPRQ